MPEGGEALAAGGVEERPSLRGAPGLEFPVAIPSDARWISGVDRAPREALPAHCVLERSVQGGVHVTDRERGQATLAVLLAAEGEPCVERVDLRPRGLLQGHGS